MNPDGACFSLTPLPVSTRGAAGAAQLTLPECQIMTVPVMPEAKNKSKRVKIVFNEHRDPTGSDSQRVQRLTGLVAVITGFDHYDAILKVDNDNVLIVPLRHCALYTA